jgi:hypothetical protein
MGTSRPVLSCSTSRVTPSASSSTAPSDRTTRSNITTPAWPCRVTVAVDGVLAQLLLLGDLAYPGVKRLFDEGEDENVEWDVVLAPHHCSKSAFYFAEGEEEEPTLKQDVVDAMTEAAAEGRPSSRAANRFRLRTSRATILPMPTRGSATRRSATRSSSPASTRTSTRRSRSYSSSSPASSGTASLRASKPVGFGRCR